MELKAYISPLFKWWWLILAATLLGAISGYLTVSQQPPTYEAVTTLIIGGAFDNPNPSSNELFLSQQLTATYRDIAQRQPVRDKTKDALGVTWLPEYSARALPNSNLLEISVIDISAHRAQAVANELANELILQSPTAPKLEDQEREAFINAQLDSLQIKIEETEDGISAKQVELEDAFSAREIEDLEVEIAALQGKLTTLQANYAALLPTTEGGAINTLAVIESASLPQGAIGPNVPVAVLTTAAVGFALATLAAYLLEYLDDTIKTPEDVKRATGLAALPGIPYFENNIKQNSVIAETEPRSPSSDAFRRLRTGIFSKDDARQLRTLLVTSATPGEGKSSIAANLAVVMAQGDQETLLLDADLRRPTQQKVFGLQGGKGFTDLLNGYKLAVENGNLDELIKQTVQKTSVDGLTIITSGPIRGNEFRLLNSEMMDEVFSDLIDRFDIVVIDSPPVLAASDSLSLATLADGVLIVTDSRKLRRKQLIRATEQLEDINVYIVGISLNRVTSSSSGYQYEYYDYYEQPKDQVATNHERDERNPSGFNIARLRDRLKRFST